MNAFGTSYDAQYRRVHSLDVADSSRLAGVAGAPHLADLLADLCAKRQSSEEHPFYEISAKKMRAAGSDATGFAERPISAAVSASNAPFIRDTNLRFSLSKNPTPVPVPGPAARTRHCGVADDATPVAGAGSGSSVPHESIRRTAEKSTASAPVGPNASDKAPTCNSPPEAAADDDKDVSLEVLEEMHRLEECFPVLGELYQLINKIGEGTFSTVYKAAAMDGMVVLGSQMWKSPPLQRTNARCKPKKNALVALKQIYVTSSPNRIHNELNLLYMLSGNAHVAPLLDILRYQDQVVAILPYYHHSDFRDYYRDLPIKGIKKYMWELLQGLEFVHSKGVIHRDLKPTNFLYDPFKGKGVLVDFGLAELTPLAPPARVSNACPCLSKEHVSTSKAQTKRLSVRAAYPKSDQRPPRRANRAGTRGFRAPEVLFKCTNQSAKIDVWSAGIIGLSLLARKFPLFNSPDDISAVVEILIVFGVDKTLRCAELHGCALDLNMPQVQRTSFNGNLVKFVGACLLHEERNGCLAPDSVIYDTVKFLEDGLGKLVRPACGKEGRAEGSGGGSAAKDLDDYYDLKHYLQLLYLCLNLDPIKRASATQLLKLPFFSELEAPGDDEVVL